MKRFLTALGVGAAITLFCVSPSSAAPTPVQQSRLNLSTAEADWDVDSDRTDGTIRSVHVDVAQWESGRILSYRDKTTIFEADHDTTAQTIITKSELYTGDFTFTAQQALKGATLSAQDIPATNCSRLYEFGEPGDIDDCTDTTVTMSVKWVGVGETSRDVSQFHSGPPISDLVQNTHNITFVRQATATGTFNDEKLGTATHAVLGMSTIGQTCVGCS